MERAARQHRESASEAPPSRLATFRAHKQSSAISNQAMQQAAERQAGEAAEAVAGHGLSGGGACHCGCASCRAGKSHGARPLDSSIRPKFERAFGLDLGGVRIHDDSSAARDASLLNAAAFTQGNDIYFGPGLYDPGSAGGQHLLAHEITHTIQQRQPFAPAPGLVPLTHVPPGAIQKQNFGPNAARDQEGREHADEVYDALDGINDEQRAITALRGRDADMRERIRTQFHLRHPDTTLRAYLREQLNGLWLVYGYALTRAESTSDYQTAMAEALIPLGTRDEEVNRILYALPLTGRQEMERQYNQWFGREGNGEAEKIGNGSLKEDLIDDLSGWRQRTALVLLVRNLTSADILFFDSVAITGTHTDSVISRIQNEWEQGPARFAQLEADWDTGVKGQRNGAPDIWTNFSLSEAMDDELSGESWGLVRAVLDNYESYKRGAGAPTAANAQFAQQLQAEATQPLSEDQAYAREEILLNEADQAYAAAAAGLGTDNQQIYRAVRRIREIWEGRIARARQAYEQTHGEAERIRLADHQDRWDTRRANILAILPEEMDTDTPEYKRARLMLYGQLTPADEVWLAKSDVDYDHVRSLVTSFWAQGKIGELLSGAREAKLDPEGHELRPTFDPTFLVPVTSGDDYLRVFDLIREDCDDAQRGSARFNLEIQSGDNDSDLRRAYDLLTMRGISANLRDSVISTYVASHLAAQEGQAPVDQFLGHIAVRYERSNTYWDFLNLLKPSSNPSERVERAQGQYNAAHTGVLTAILSIASADYDLITGEDTELVTLESIARLRHISNATPEELQAMMVITGSRSVDELSAMEFSLFQSRLNELRSVRQGIADAVATAVQIAIEAALTVATGGAAAPMLFASLAATAAGMVARELLLGQDYDLVSRQNAEQLAMVLASAGFAHLGTGVANAALGEMQHLTRAGAFLHGAISEGVTQVGTRTFGAAFDGRLPNAEGIGIAALQIIAASGGAGTRSRIMHAVQEDTPAFDRVRTSVVAHVTQNLVTGIGEEGANLLRADTSNLSAGDITGRFGSRAAGAIGRGVTTGVAVHYGQQVQVARDARRRQEEDLEDAAHDRSRLPPGDESLNEPPVRDPHAPQTLSITAVNEMHALSVRRMPDGRIRIIICSPLCGEVIQLIEATQRTLARNADQPIRDSLTDHLNELRQVQTLLEANPADVAAAQRLQTAARGVGQILSVIGDEQFFGILPPEQAPGAPATVSPPGTAVPDESIINRLPEDLRNQLGSPAAVRQLVVEAGLGRILTLLADLSSAQVAEVQRSVGGRAAGNLAADLSGADVLTLVRNHDASDVRWAAESQGGAPARQLLTDLSARSVQGMRGRGGASVSGPVAHGILLQLGAARLNGVLPQITGDDLRVLLEEHGQALIEYKIEEAIRRTGAALDKGTVIPPGASPIEVLALQAQATRAARTASEAGGTGELVSPAPVTSATRILDANASAYFDEGRAGLIRGRPARGAGAITSNQRAALEYVASVSTGLPQAALNRLLTGIPYASLTPAEQEVVLNYHTAVGAADLRVTSLTITEEGVPTQIESVRTSAYFDQGLAGLMEGKPVSGIGAITPRQREALEYVASVSTGLPQAALNRFLTGIPYASLTPAEQDAIRNYHQANGAADMQIVPVSRAGLPPIDRTTAAYSTVIRELETVPNPRGVTLAVGGTGGKGMADRTIVADAFFAGPSGTTNTFVSADGGVLTDLFRLSDIPIATLGSQSVREYYIAQPARGFTVTSRGTGRAIFVVPI